MRSTNSSAFSKPAAILAAVVSGCACHAPTQAADSWEETPVYGQFQTFTKRNGIPDNRIRALRVVGNEVWVGTEGGLALRDGDEWRSWTREEGMPADAINAVDVDPRTSDVWLGTWGQGLVRFSAGRFDVFDQMNSGLAGDLVFDVLVRGSRVWAATNAGVSVYDTQTDTWDLHNARRADRAGPAITALALGGNNLYGGTWAGFPLRFDYRLSDWVSILGATEESDIKTRLASHDPITTGAIAARDSGLWWATGSTLLRRDSQGNWNLHQTPPFNAPVESMAAFSSADGEQAWISTGDGLHVFADRSSDTWVVYKACDRDVAGTVAIQRGGHTVGTRAVYPALPDNRIRCAAFQGDDVWIGTANGLALGTERTPWNQLPESPTIAGIDSGAPCRATLSRTLDPATSGPDARESKSPAIAVFGPRSRTIALAGEAQGKTRRGWTDLLGVQLATEESNARGGYRGSSSFEIVTTSVGYSRYGWGTEEDDLVAFASYDNVQGIVGFLGAGDQIRDAVVFRTQVPFLNVGAASESIAKPAGRNPWVFKCYGGEPRQHRMLLDYVFDRLGLSRVAVLRARSRTGERHLNWWSDYAAVRGSPVVADIRLDGASEIPAETLESLRRSRPDVMLTWCDMATSAALLRSMRRAGMRQLFVGSKEIVGDDFASLVGVDPGPVIAMYPTRPLREGRAVSGFSRRYSERNVIGSVPTPPGLEAYRSYDATDHLLEAINTAGPGREAVRRVLGEMARSASGEEHYERRHGRDKVVIARLEAGGWKFKMIP